MWNQWHGRARMIDVLLPYYTSYTLLLDNSIRTTRIYHVLLNRTLLKTATTWYEYNQQVNEKLPRCFLLLTCSTPYMSERASLTDDEGVSLPLFLPRLCSLLLYRYSQAKPPNKYLHRCILWESVISVRYGTLRAPELLPPQRPCRSAISAPHRAHHRLHSSRCCARQPASSSVS
jgi:hypothetical protein